MPTRDNYEKLRVAATGDAFRREYDDIRREWLATRATFDNTHDNMTDVWDFPRVHGDERHGHATPKPVRIMSRILRSSSLPGGNVCEPFLGSGSTLIACEIERRTCFGLELAPTYVDTVCARWQKLTGVMPERESTGEIFDFIGGQP